MAVQPSFIVHGGAGKISDDLLSSYREGVRAAGKLAWEMLQAGHSALNVVEQAVRIMEDDPAFDAGRGSHLNAKGQVELDALIMDGSTLANGAVASVRHISNPISLARRVMTDCDHALLVGEGAMEFAEQIGVQLVADDVLIVERELLRWHEFHPDGAGIHDTVGAVARDQDGNIAVATSTGGTLNKMPGRVGDSPLIGCGGYADNLLGGASSTGVGEDLMKIVMCKTACDLMGSGLDAQSASDQALRRLSDPRINGSGGVICLDREGRIGLSYNTEHMARAYVRNGVLVAEV